MSYWGTPSPISTYMSTDPVRLLGESPNWQPLSYSGIVVIAILTAHEGAASVLLFGRPASDSGADFPGRPLPSELTLRILMI